LFARIGMETDVVLSVHRQPDFDALYRLQSDEWESWVGDLDGAIEGTATIVIRNGWLQGKPSRVGYLGDLRMSSRARGRQLLDRFYGPILRSAAERHGCAHFLTTVIASNALAMRALTRETAHSVRAGRPRYTPLRDFDIRSVHLLPPRRRRRSSVRVRHATAADIPRLAAFLERDARARPFGYAFTDAMLRRRFATWPGLSIESFYLADQGGDLAGAFALWDAAPVKRMVVRDYRHGMRRVKLGYDLAARLLGLPRLPQPGEPFRYLYVTHQAIPSRDPEILRSLLDAAYTDVRGTGYHFISICAYHDDPLERAFDGFFTTNLHTRLFLVTLPETPIPPDCLNGAPPGFEMALV
jgi:hypothetical protein